MITLCLLALAGTAAWVLAFLGDPTAAWRALLVAFLFFTSVAAGAVVASGVVTLAQGRWAQGLERFALAGVAFAPVSLALLVALALAHGHWLAPLEHVHGSKAAWLDPTFRLLRDGGALLVFWVLAAWYVATRARRGHRRPAAVLTVVYGIVFTLLGYDLVMGLDPTWKSGLFGAYFFVSALYGGLAAWTLASALAGADGRRLADLGNLLLAFCLLTTYAMFSQLLPLWYGNKPHEIAFLRPRLDSAAWGTTSLVLLALVYLGPIAMLLFRRVKTTPALLGAVAVLVLTGLWIERWWLVLPTLGGEARVGWADAGAAAALAALLVLGGGLAGRRLPAALPPVVEGLRD